MTAAGGTSNDDVPIIQADNLTSNIKSILYRLQRLGVWWFGGVIQQLDDALGILGDKATHEELRILDAFQDVYKCFILLKSMMGVNQAMMISVRLIKFDVDLHTLYIELQAHVVNPHFENVESSSMCQLLRVKEHIKVNQRVIKNIMSMKEKFGSCANMGREEDRGELED